GLDPVPPGAVEPRPGSIPEPVAIASVPTVNVTSPPQEIQSASQAFFSATDPSRSPASAPQPYSPAPSAYGEPPASAPAAWDEEPAPARVSKGLKIGIGAMGTLILGIGVFMFWPRKPPATDPAAAVAPPPTAVPAIAATPPPVVEPPPEPTPVVEKKQPV